MEEWFYCAFALPRLNNVCGGYVAQSLRGSAQSRSFPRVPSSPAELSVFLKRYYSIVEKAKLITLRGEALEPTLLNWLWLLGAATYHAKPGLQGLSVQHMMAVIFLVNGQFHGGVAAAGIYKRLLQQDLLKYHRDRLEITPGVGRYAGYDEIRCGIWITHKKSSVKDRPERQRKPKKQE
jgi:hypothetical protein